MYEMIDVTLVYVFYHIWHKWSNVHVQDDHITNNAVVIFTGILCIVDFVTF